jgi:hypothetical protein
MSSEAPSLCAPDRFCHHRQTGCCLTLDDLAQVEAATRPPGPGPAEGAPTFATLLRTLHRRFGTKRGGETAWLDAPAVRSRPALHARLTRAFRPTAPTAWAKNPRFWLSSLDIQRVMEQYVRRNSDFYFAGVHPLDFASPADGNAANALPPPPALAPLTAPMNALAAPLNATARASPRRRCISQSMCDLDVARLGRAGHRHVGAVINMDRHDSAGSHWVACYAGLDPARPLYGIYYYDSVALPPPREIADFMRRHVAAQAARLPSALRTAHTNAAGRPFEIRHNTVRRQFKNTECGVFSVFFLLSCIEGRKTFDQICADTGADDDMHALRRVLFRLPPPGKTGKAGKAGKAVTTKSKVVKVKTVKGRAVRAVKASGAGVTRRGAPTLAEAPAARASRVR